MYLVGLKLSVYQLLLVICAHSTQNNADKEDKQRVSSIVQQWAPKIWLDPQEQFFPSSVSDFLKEVTPTKINCENCAFTAPQLPVGSTSLDYFLITTTNKDVLLNNKSSILYGSNPTHKNVSVYAYVTLCDTLHDHFIITYWTFYPFNQGKELCTIRLGKSRAIPVLRFFKKCVGKTKTFGSHIGDWEHMSLEIKNSTPSSMFLSVHDVGVFYTYDDASKSFVISSAKTRGISEVQDAPPTVQVVDGHPNLFAAKGSHALWGSVGSHKYTKLKLNQLVDVVDYGTPWESWKNLKVFYSDDATPDWYNYWGKWGNPSSGCLALSKIGMKDVCLFSNGPRGLSKRHPDFNCNSK